jgi:uncharacterized protein
MSIRFVWHDKKAKRNKRAHGVTFEDATEVFTDPKYIELFDNAHSQDEDRWNAIGMSSKGILFVVFCERGVTKQGEEIIRIISARKAEFYEVEIYEQYNRQFEN